MIYPAMLHCTICPRNCRVDRYAATGFCGAPADLVVNLRTLHHGEEPCISGTRGSGTIFFSWCNLHCVFCQNHCISALGWGESCSPETLVNMMLSLQQRGAHNINLVTPTPYTVQLTSAIKAAREAGLSIPLVWNSSAYEKVDTLQQLAGLVDIYLPDYKYAHGIYAKKYSGAVDYPEVAMAAIKEMHKQVGTLQLDSHGSAVKGMIIRLLVLPYGLAGTDKALRLIADELGTEITLSLMGQYYPAAEAARYPELSRGITSTEYNVAVQTAMELGFNHVYCQELSCSDAWTPSFEPKLTKLTQEFYPTMEQQ